jgi:protein transport protein SEC24
MGINLTNENISCDVFACAEKKINTLTLNQICEYTNGHFYFYKNFNLDLHYKNIFNQVRRVLSRPICWEGLNFVRLSHGYKVMTYSAPILITNLGYFVFPTGDSDQNYLINVEPPSVTTEGEKEKSYNLNNLDDNEQYLYIQNSLFYSYGDGTRRIRVHNLCIPLSSNIRYIYKKLNPELLASFYLKETINKIYKNKNISNSIISTDDQFKHFIDKVMSIENRMNRELMPNLIYLPLYMIGMFKHRIFCKDEIDKNYELDISNYLRISLQKMSYQEIISFICPSIYSLHEFENNKKLGTYDEITKEFNIPNVISLSKSAMVENGLYLIDNGYLLIIYIRKNISQYILQNLFGVENLSFLTMIINEENVFGEESNEFKDRIKNLLDYIRTQKSIFQNLIFVFEGAGGERIINESLIEDNYCNWYPMNYYNFYNKYIKENTLTGY